MLLVLLPARMDRMIGRVAHIYMTAPFCRILPVLVILAASVYIQHMRSEFVFSV